MSTEDRASVPVGFREEVDAIVQRMVAGFISFRREYPDEVKAELVHARDQLEHEIPRKRPAICEKYLELTVVDKMKKHGLAGDMIMSGLFRGAFVIADLFRDHPVGYWYVSMRNQGYDEPMEEFWYTLENEKRDKLSDQTGFSLVDSIADDFLPRSVQLLEKHPGTKLLILAGADLARKIYKEVYPLSEGLEPRSN